MMSISLYFKKIRHWFNYSPPTALSSTGWRLFNLEFKNKAPVRYWIGHIGDEYFRPIRWKYDNIVRWIRYRTISRNHILKTGLTPGYYEIDTKMLHVNFNMLKDYVEVELASFIRYSSDHKKSFAEKYIPFYNRFSNNRFPEYGIQHLQWEMGLDDPSLPAHSRSVIQAEGAREIFALYDWWVNKRPQRKLLEPADYNDQGFGMLGCFDDDFDRTAPDYKEYLSSLNDINKQEEEFQKEDDEMLARLIKIRHRLWS